MKVQGRGAEAWAACRLGLWEEGRGRGPQVFDSSEAPTVISQGAFGPRGGPRGIRRLRSVEPPTGPTRLLCLEICPRLRKRDRSGIIEHGNAPNCRLNSCTLTTYKLWSHMAFRPVDPIYHPPALPFFCHLRQFPCARPTVSGPAASNRQQTTANEHLRYGLETVQTLL